MVVEWFGFNVGSVLEVGGMVMLVFVNMLIVMVVVVLSWLVVEWLLKGKFSLLGVVFVVGGLVWCMSLMKREFCCVFSRLDWGFCGAGVWNWK